MRLLLTRSAPRARVTLTLLLACVAALSLVATAGGALAPGGQAALLAAAPQVGSTAPALAHAASTQALSPAQIHAAYGLPDTGAPRQTIAVVSPYDDPHAQADLNAYTKRFKLPSCTAANHCFRKLNQQGKLKPLPPRDPTGGTFTTESALGIEIARGVCQSCSILLVEPNSTGTADIAQAVNGAAKAGATVIVTAFTNGEDPLEARYASDFSHPRAAVVAAAGDGADGQFGYSGSLNYPAAMRDVIAVGGTQLTLSKRGGYGGERVWSDTVSGCSFYVNAPSWQAKDARAVGCGPKRANADIAAVASPGAIVHITGAGTPGGPWYVAEGTSLAAPVIAGAIGLAGSVGSREAQMLYNRARTHPKDFHDIVSGRNGDSFCPSLICKAGRGYDGPSGLGTPNGLAAFRP
jgi:hypothetical protein